MTDAARPLQHPPREQPEIPISLIRGGTFYKAQEKVGLSDVMTHLLQAIV